MLSLCFVKLISILLNYKVKDNILLPQNVCGKATNKLYLFEKKKGKNQLTLCSIKLTWSLVVFHLAWNGSATKKLWLGLQFCRLLQDLQLQYLWMSGNISTMLINGGNFINNNFTSFCRSKVSFGIQQRLKSGGSQKSFIQGGSAPRSCFSDTIYTYKTFMNSWRF